MDILESAKIIKIGPISVGCIGHKINRKTLKLKWSTKFGNREVVELLKPWMITRKNQ